MKYIVLIVSVLLLAACSSSRPPDAVGHSSTAPTSAVSTSSRPSPAASIAAMMNARMIVNGLATGSSSEVSSLGGAVSGPVMDAYIRIQALEDEAYAAEGQALPSGSVNKIPGGYDLCWPSNPCLSFTGFRSSAAGRITDFRVDRKLVSGRVAMGGESTGSGLEISDVSSLVDTTGTLDVTFMARDISWNPVNTSPPFIPVFVASDGSRFTYDFQQSLIPSSLQPGQSAAVEVVFDTDKLTGQFSLTENGPGNVIVSAMLHKVRAQGSKLGLRSSEPREARP